MDIFKLISALEEVIYQISLMVFLIPKTIIHVIRHPGWPQQYIDSELEKAVDVSFDEFVPPLTLWSLTVVLPYMYLPLPFIGEGWIPFVSRFEQRFLLIGFILISFPLFFSICFLSLKKENIAKSTIKRFFLSQCYIFTPVFIFIYPILYCLDPYDSKDYGLLELNATRIVVTSLITAWLILSETKTIRHIFGYSTLKSLLTCFFCLFMTVNVISCAIFTPLLIWEMIYHKL